MPGITDASAPLPHERLRGSGYGFVLGLILISLAFQLGAPDESWAHVTTLALQTATLVAAFHVSGIHAWLLRLAAGIAIVATLAATGILIGSGEIDAAGGRGVGLMLVVLAPVAILAGMIRHYRAVGGVTLTTMFGVLCIYLLSGMAFAFAYGLIGEIDPDPFFAEPDANEEQAEFLYFSFTTMTTTGYGDLTAALSSGRAVAITQQLFGQIYLVTVVALIVSNLGRRRPAVDEPGLPSERRP
jgi:hypothetical protein